MNERGRYLAMLVLLGVGWGSTQPMGKIATETGHGPFGLIFWQSVVCVLVLGVITGLRGRRLIWSAGVIRFSVIVALIGTLIPNTTFYISVTHLPASIMSILISAVPMLSFPIAMALGMDRFSALRLLGLGLGLGGVLLLASPGAGVWSAGLVVFIPLALVGPLFYALEANYVAKFGTAGMDAVQAMLVASLVAMILSLPLTIGTGQMFNPIAAPGRAEVALAVSSGIHALCYAGYVWLAARAGAVFAAQCSYLVTGAGVLWAMLLLNEQLPAQAAVSLVLMMAGVAMVSPRRAGRADVA